METLFHFDMAAVHVLWDVVIHDNYIVLHDIKCTYGVVCKQAWYIISVVDWSYLEVRICETWQKMSYHNHV